MRMSYWVLRQALVDLLLRRKLLDRKEVVGASGFEPPTSWSRTMNTNSINALSCVAYGTRSLVSPLLIVRGLSVAQRLGASSIRLTADRLISSELAGVRR